MNCTLIRHSYSAKGIFGNLFDENKNIIAVTGEHAYLQPYKFTDENNNIVNMASFFAKIPTGTYNCIRRLSPKFDYDLFMLENVPGADFIEIHKGNDPQVDSEGCIILGRSLVEDALVESKYAFARFMAIQNAIKSFSLEIR